MSLDLTKRVENTNTEIKAYDDEIKVKKNAIETSKGMIKNMESNKRMFVTIALMNL